MRFLAPIDKGLYLRRVPLFGDLPADSLSVLSEYATEELIPKGTVFQEAGAPVETVRAIVEGAVSCALPDGGTFLLGPDSVTGVFEFFAGPTIAGLTAKEDVLSLAIPTARILRMLEEHFDVLVHVFRGLGRTLIRSLEHAPGLAGSSSAPELPLHPAHPELGEVERILALRQAMAFREASVDGLAAIARVARVEHLATGATLWTENDPADWLGVIVHGVVACETSRREGRFYFSEGAANAVGFLDTLAGDERWYGAVAHTDVVLLAIKKDDLLDTLEDHFHMAFSCLSAFSAYSMEIVARLRDAPGLSPNEAVSRESQGSGLSTPASAKPREGPRS
jgi:CRP-like cAMP-binding protein